MASNDNFDITNPMLTVQDPEGSSAAKTPPSDGSGRASPPTSSPRQQEQVQSLKDPLEVVVDDPTEPEDDLIAKTKVPDIMESDITSDASVSGGSTEPRVATDGSGGGDGRGEPRTWSLTEEEQVRNLERNCRQVAHVISKLYGKGLEVDSASLQRVVAKLRANPYLAISEIAGILKTADGEDSEPFLQAANPLHFAVLMGDLHFVQEILQTCSVPEELDIDECLATSTTLDLAIMGGESDILEALLQKNAKAHTPRSTGSLQLAVLHSRPWQPEKTYKIIQWLMDKGVDINGKDYLGNSAFLLAVSAGKTDIVKQLLQWKDKIHLNEEGPLGGPPIQFAKEYGLKDIESELMKCEEVKGYIEAAFRDRQAYVDAANAILVGAALIASVTFASWLQPPLNYTTSYHGSSLEYVDVEHNIALGSFWVFNTLSFYFAIGTVVFGACSVLPRRQLFITKTVKKLSQNLFVTSVLLAFSVVFVIIAFGIAGIIVLIPILRYQLYMIAPMIFGGLVCLGSIGYLFKNLWENIPWKNKEKKNNIVSFLKESNIGVLFYESD